VCGAHLPWAAAATSSEATAVPAQRQRADAVNDAIAQSPATTQSFATPGDSASEVLMNSVAERIKAEQETQQERALQARRVSENLIVWGSVALCVLLGCVITFFIVLHLLRYPPR